MDECRVRREEDGTLQLPVAYLTCNFTRPVGEAPALLTHDEVTTLFHEFGHGLHHMLTRQTIADISGINGVAWDAVELPSQFMENYCWEREGLDLIAGHVETGEPLPDELFDKLLAAKNFQSAMGMVRQLEFSLFDFRLHLETSAPSAADIQALLDEVRNSVSVVPRVDFNRFQNGFGHIFAGGYAAGYYSYKWAEVLSADAGVPSRRPVSSTRRPGDVSVPKFSSAAVLETPPNCSVPSGGANQASNRCCATAASAPPDTSLHRFIMRRGHPRRASPGGLMATQKRFIAGAICPRCARWTASAVGNRTACAIASASAAISSSSFPSRRKPRPNSRPASAGPTRTRRHSPMTCRPCGFSIPVSSTSLPSQQGRYLQFPDPDVAKADGGVVILQIERGAAVRLVV